MSDSDDNNSADNSDQQYTVIDQSYGQDNDDHDSNSKHHRRSEYHSIPTFSMRFRSHNFIILLYRSTTRIFENEKTRNY